MTLSVLRGRRATSPWTDERDILIARLWLEGYSASQIADRIADVAVSRCAVIGRAHRLKLPARKSRSPARALRQPRRLRFGSVPKPPAPPPRPRPPPPPPLGPPAMRMLSLFELTPSQCHFPIGEPTAFFCAADADGIYCPFHQRMTHRESSDL